MKITDTESKLSIEKEILLEVQERLLKAFIDFVVIARIEKMSCTNISYIMSFFKKNYNVKFNPGQAYPLFSILEQKGLIKMLPNRPVKLYVLTDKGKIVLEIFRKKSDFFKKILLELVINDN